MQNPFKYRPESAPAGDGEEPDDWEDNTASNALAWASQVVTPAWCSTPEHWTSRLSNAMWTSCPCCLFFRGALVGACAGGALVATVVAALQL